MTSLEIIQVSGDNYDQISCCPHQFVSTNTYFNIAAVRKLMSVAFVDVNLSIQWCHFCLVSYKIPAMKLWIKDFNCGSYIV